MYIWDMYIAIINKCVSISDHHKCKYKPHYHWTLNIQWALNSLANSPLYKHRFHWYFLDSFHKHKLTSLICINIENELRCDWIHHSCRITCFILLIAHLPLINNSHFSCIIIPLQNHLTRTFFLPWAYFTKNEQTRSPIKNRMV